MIQKGAIIRKKKLFFISIIVVFFAVFLNFFVFFLVKKAVIRKLAAVTREKVSFQSLTYCPFLNFTLRKLVIGESFSADSIYIKLHVSDLFANKFFVKELSIINPVFKINRMDSELSQPLARISFPLIAEHISIKNATIDFFDRVILDKGLQVKLQNLDLDIINVENVFPKGIIQFNSQAKLIFPSAVTGSASVSGWLDWQNKNMDAKLTVFGLDAIYLYPYYSQSLDMGKAHVKEAIVDFSSRIYSISNDLKAECRLKLDRYSFFPSETQDVSREEKTARLVLEIFKNLDDGSVLLEFNLNTKMDKPQLDLLVLSKAFEEKINKGIKIETIKVEDTVILPQKIIKGTVKSVSEIGKAIFGSTLDWGKELKQSISDTFIKVSPAGKSADTKKGELK